jgi:triacylglycerol esterase/lipase EstA (alpha/beta hydrolase family)
MRRALAAVAVLAFPGTASAMTYAPLNHPGPRLTVPAAKLRASLGCTDDVNHAARAPVLLIPATEVNSDENFSWNYERSFRSMGIPYCTTNQPGDDQHNLNDMQTRAEYIVYAIRRMHRMAGRRIVLMGHSQGGMIMRWPLRFWPGLRPMVEEIIGMAGTNHGSTNVDTICSRPCAPAIWQQGSKSRWTAALNSRGQTFAGIDYTEIYSHTDEFVTPNADDTGSSSVHGPGRITNVATQDICPGDTYEHLFIGTIDPVAAALVFDALGHSGPAEPERIDPAVCGEQFMPGFDTVTGPSDLSAAVTRVFYGLAAGPTVDAEPPLRCYVTASCRGSNRRP